MPIFAMMGVTIFALLSGVALTAVGIVFIEEIWTSGLGIFLIVGLLILVSSFGMRRSLIELRQGDATTTLALYVLIEFLAGASILFIGAGPTIIDPSHREWGFVGLAVFGLILVVDSVLFYRRIFKKGADLRT